MIAAPTREGIIKKTNSLSSQLAAKQLTQYLSKEERCLHFSFLSSSVVFRLNSCKCGQQIEAFFLYSSHPFRSTSGARDVTSWKQQASDHPYPSLLRRQRLMLGRVSQEKRSGLSHPRPSLLRGITPRKKCHCFLLLRKVSEILFRENSLWEYKRNFL